MTDDDLIKCLKRSNFPVSLRTLSNTLNTSVRTLRRRINGLEEKRNAPWYITQSKVELDYHKDKLVEIEGYWFNAKELESLIALNSIIEQLLPGSLAQQLEPFQQRIHQLLGHTTENSAITQKIKLLEIASRQTQPEIFQTIIQSLAENHRLNIIFWNRYKDETTERTLSPQKLVRYKDNWILDAHCHLRQAIRSFSLEAIQQADIVQLKSIEVSQQELDAHFLSSFGSYAGQADKTAILKFSPYQSRWVENENWHPEQKGQFLPDGSYQLHIPYQKDPELVQDILKYGKEVEVIAPEALKEKVKAQLRIALNQY